MFCKNCGSHLEDNTNICPQCGYQQAVVYVNQTPDDHSSFGYALLSFFFPIIGIILFLVWKDQTPLKAKSCLKGALFTFIMGVIIAVIYFIVAATLLSTII